MQVGDKIKFSFAGKKEMEWFINLSKNVYILSDFDQHKGKNYPAKTYRSDP
jgi:hypothetical protein